MDHTTKFGVELLPISDRERAEAFGFYALTRRRRNRILDKRADRLGTNAKLRPAADLSEAGSAGRSPSQGAGEPQGLPPDALLLRYALQSGARELLKPVILEGEQIWSGEVKQGRQHRTCHCCRFPIDAEANIAVRRSAEHKTARYGNVQTCGSVWACPVCAVLVSEFRRKQLQEAVDNARIMGLRVVMLTRTVSHYACETMADVLALLKGALHRSSKSRAAEYARFRHGVVGHVRSLEVTWGRNGWHPHVHELLFVEPGYDLDKLRADYSALWAAAVEREGGRKLHGQHGFDAVDCDGKIAAYVSKWGREPDWKEGHELAKAVSKKGRKGGQYTPNELLSQYTFEGNIYAGQKWLEYALSMRGRHQLQYSRGLKDFLGVVEDLTDEEIAAQKLEGAQDFASITPPTWRRVCKSEERGRLLRLAADGDFVRFNDLLWEISPNTDAEIEREEEKIDRQLSGWRVEAKTLRAVSDKSICWRVDKRLDDAANDVSLGLTVEQGQELRASVRATRLRYGGEVADYQRFLDRVDALSLPTPEETPTRLPAD